MEQLTEALNQIEQTELQQCEQVIERGLKTFVEVGNALLTIRDKRLYRAGFGTFEDYCKNKWGLARRRAYHFIDAVNVAANLEMCTMVHKPQSERQVRPLTPLEPETQREAWQQVIEEHGDNVTAKKVQEVVDEWKEVDQQIKEAKANPMFITETPEYILRRAKENKSSVHVLNNSGENEWYTPYEFIESARYVLGNIDLDPASNDTANTVVCADTIYTIEDDGLCKGWSGSVWMNPPYSGGLISNFCDKLIYHYTTGEVTSAIVLVNNATETKWFQSLLNEASAICLPMSRIKFWNKSNNGKTPLQGQAIIYFGDEVDLFKSGFSKHGKILLVA